MNNVRAAHPFDGKAFSCKFLHCSVVVSPVQEDFAWPFHASFCVPLDLGFGLNLVRYELKRGFDQRKVKGQRHVRNTASVSTKRLQDPAKRQRYGPFLDLEKE